MSSTFLVLSAQTIEYIRNQVTSEADLTSLPVDIAIVSTGDTPLPGDWMVAGWDPNNVTKFLYQGNFGPGLYDYWVRITATPEIPIRSTGIVNFTE